MKTIKLTKQTFKEKEREYAKAFLLFFALTGLLSILATSHILNELLSITPLIFPFMWLFSITAISGIGFMEFYNKYKSGDHLPALSRV